MNDQLELFPDSVLELHLINEKDAARMLGLSRPTFHKYRKMRIGPPYYKYPSGPKYVKEDLEKWLKDRYTVAAK